MGGTSLRDAVYLAINEMKEARNARGAILIVSDGSDNSSSRSPSDFRAIVSEADLQLYAIDLSDRPNPRAFAGIIDLVNQPGALDSAVDNAAAAPTRAGRIAAGLRNLYVLTYMSTNAVRDGGYRRVQAQLVPTVGLPPLKLIYHSGYFAR